MNILIAPDSFKGSLSAIRFCEIAAQTIRSISPDTNVTLLPLADGGEGTVDATLYSTPGERVRANASDPLGRRIPADYAIVDSGRCAVIEMAAASGLPLLAEAERDARVTSSFGTGQLIRDALERGCRKIILGLGGSATNDGGAGAMQALGFGFLDHHGKALEPGGSALRNLSMIRTDGVHAAIRETEFILAADVDNPLLGPRGATAVFGPQKGVSSCLFDGLEAALTRFSQVLHELTGENFSLIPGAGAAGGMGAGCMALLNAELHSGFSVIRELTRLDAHFETGALDLVITGEGELNEQSLAGKLPVSLAKLAKQHGVPVVAIAGNASDTDLPLHEVGISTVLSIVDRPMLLAEAMREAEVLLPRCINRLMALLKLGATMKQPNGFSACSHKDDA